MRTKSYKITACLKEGYAEHGTVHTVREAEDCIALWMEERLAANLPTTSGLLSEGVLFFPSKETQNDNPVTKSPTIIYRGDLTSKADLDLTDMQVTETLESLAYSLKKRLGQEVVYIIYKNNNWAV